MNDIKLFTFQKPNTMNFDMRNIMICFLICPLSVSCSIYSLINVFIFRHITHNVYDDLYDDTKSIRINFVTVSGINE